MSSHNERLDEARAIGSILPCHWTAAQRERAIELIGKGAAFVDEMIWASRVINGMEPSPLPSMAHMERVLDETKKGFR